MASEPDKEEMENREEIVSIELPAPKGWKKKFTPKKGGTPRRNEIIFISPAGEEIKSKRQLEQFLKSHPGGPSASEFDWGTGDTPRRSARISEKSKATETPESEPPKKVQKRSSSKKGAKEKKDDIDGEGETAEEKEAAATTAEETKESAEVEMKDAQDAGDHEEALTLKVTVKDSEQKTEEKIDEMNMEKQDNQETINKTTSDAKEEAGNNSLLTPGPEEYKEEAEKERAEPEAPSPLPVTNETASSEQEAKVVKEAVPVEADAKVEKESEEAKVGQEDSPDKEISSEKVANVGEVKPDSDSLKEDQEVAKPVENHSVSCEESPHEPKASQVSC